MANLKADSPLCRRIVLSFLDFLNSVEPSSVANAESLQLAKECLSVIFKIGSLSSVSVPTSDSLVQLFSSRPVQDNGIKSEQACEKFQADTSSTVNVNAPENSKIPEASQTLGDTNKKDDCYTRWLKDPLFVEFFGALEKARYFESPSSNGDPPLSQASWMYDCTLWELEKSGATATKPDLKKLADFFKLQGNKCMQSKLYPDAISFYSVAVALCDDNAVYHCNRAAAYTQVKMYTEAIHDCNKAIELDPKYNKAFSRLGFVYYAQGNYKDAIESGFKKALELDPTNEAIKGNIKAAEKKLGEE
ncbi:uncharacterized protein [Rutidosis leptorrhynchoides]|uniref:uncharacterized protein isoform X2 n=1 Tax=Rutidosis leptorrhynchoides TaxID=125765 RepID=UPI003A991D36